MDKEVVGKIEAEYKFWIGNCPHPDFTKHINSIMGGLGYRKPPKDKPLLFHADGCTTNPGVIGATCNCGAEAQREADIKFYTKVNKKECEK